MSSGATGVASNASGRSKPRGQFVVNMNFQGLRQVLALRALRQHVGEHGVRTLLGEPGLGQQLRRFGEVRVSDQAQGGT